MKETGIIMSGDHPAKVLAGTKTMTRRLTKLHEYNKEPDKWNIRPGVNCQFADSIERNKYNLPSQQIYIKCPYGLVGDRLWVRETWAVATTLNKTKPSDLLKKYSLIPITYKATYPNESHYMWRPLILMPRWASRITLEITGVRVERLQEIKPEDVIKEGVEYYKPVPNEYLDTYLIYMFEELWNSLNAKRGYGWEANPWVWVIEFKRVDNDKKND